MHLPAFYTLISVIFVSLVSFVGLLLYKKKNIEEYLLLLVSLSAGTLFGGAFLHLLPESIEKNGLTISVSLLILSGILVFFLIEKFIHGYHCHSVSEHLQSVNHHPVHLAPLNLIGDGMHNFLDGLVIAGSYLVSIPTGIATTIAVVVHEIPQEIADFGVLLYSGLSKNKALWLNFLSAAAAIIGAILGLVIGGRSASFVSFIIPFTIGGFIYIAGSSLLPELHKECGLKDSFWHFIAIIVGILLMLGLRFWG